MASAVATAAARSMPPYTVPVGPRIRPPRLLPGTKAANTDPQPSDPPSIAGDVWVQGKWRNPKSNAAKDRRAVQSAQAEKALRHATHGMNIYAYNHIRTNQVVYSLTRIMQNHKILSQLLFHGKKTVPAELRRDLWRPYFSIHFPPTSAGAAAGLEAYQRLRELATLRQLSPPSDLVIATGADVEKARRKYSPYELWKKEKDHEKKNMPIENMPVENEQLPKQKKAKKLMDQKASSVADAAFVLRLINEGPTPAEKEDAIFQRREEKQAKLSKRAARRLSKIRERELVKDAQIETRKELVSASEGRLGLTPHAARRVALEHGGVVTAPWKGSEYTVNNIDTLQNRTKGTSVESSHGTDVRSLPVEERAAADFDADDFRLRYAKAWQEENVGATEGPPSEEVEAAVKQEQERIQAQVANNNVRAVDTTAVSAPDQNERNDRSKTVQVLWADLRDAAWAQQWSTNVYHGELDLRAAIRYERVLNKQKATINEQGDEIPGQVRKIVMQSSTTPHIFGNNNSNEHGAYETPDTMTEKRREWRESRLREWRDQKLVKSREYLDQIGALYRQREGLRRQKLDLQPEFDALERGKMGLGEPEDVITRMTEAEKEELRTSMRAVQDSITTTDQEIAELEHSYPTLHGQVSEVLEWRVDTNTFTSLLQIERQIENVRTAFESEDPEASEQLEQIDLDIMTYVERHPDLENVRDLAADLASRVNSYRGRIQGLEVRVGSDESPAEQSLHDVQGSIRNLQNLIASDRIETFGRRLEYVRTTLDDLEGADRLGSQVASMLRQRQHALEEDQTETVASIDRDLKVREDEIFVAVLGLEPPKPVQAEETEYDEEMREKGVEAPRPQEKRRGLWARVSGLFGGGRK